MPGNVSKLRRYGPLCLTQTLPVPHRVFSHDVTAAILVAKNNEMGAMLVYLTNPVGAELFSYGNTFFCCNECAWLLATSVK